MSETFLPLINGGWINARFVGSISQNRKGEWSAEDRETNNRYNLAFNVDDCFRPTSFVAGGQTAHVFWCDVESDREPTLDDIVEQKTTVIAWRIYHDHHYWATPILLDTTDADNATADHLPMIVIEDHGGFEDVGTRTFDDLDQVRAEVVERAKREQKRRAV